MIAFIFCSSQDNRVDLWKNLLQPHCYLICVIKASGKNYYQCNDNSSIPIRSMEAEERIIQNDFLKVAFVHTGMGDPSLFVQSKEQFSFAFLFTTPGFETSERNAVDISEFTHSQSLCQIYFVYRTTGSQDGFTINSNDIQELIHFVTGQRQEMPSICSPDDSGKFLPALSILCQGYLAAHADFDDSYVRTALEKMEWHNSFMAKFDNALVIASDLAREQAVVRKSEWWLEVFDEILASDHLEKIEKIKVYLEIEWKSKVDERVDQLLNALNNEIIHDPAIVANAYLAISHRLAQEELITA